MEEVAARRVLPCNATLIMNRESSSFVLASSVGTSRGGRTVTSPRPRGSDTVHHRRARSFRRRVRCLSRASSSAARGALDDVVVLDVARDAWFRPQITGSRPPGRAGAASREVAARGRRW